MEYIEWNDLIAGHFFNSSNVGRRVYLFVTKELLAELGQAHAVDFEDFIHSVKIGPTWVSPRSSLCQKALQALQDWRERGFKYPPYITYLALFVLAASLEGDFAPNAYYPKLRTLLGDEPASGQLPSFPAMIELWDDLERWSERDKDGELGTFHHDFFGEWMHCGLPKAQSLLSDNERHTLPRIFGETGLEPGAPPPAAELVDVLVERGRGLLRHQTVEVLKGRVGGSDLGDALIETFISELREWDGVLPELIEGSEDQAELVRATCGALRLCCKLDRTAGIAHLYFRCKAPEQFPEDGLHLEIPGESGSLLAEEWGAGWSCAIADEYGRVIDASRFDWSSSLVTQDKSQCWRFRMAVYPVRILAVGECEGLPDLVELRKLPERSDFYLAVRDDYRDRVSVWGSSACDGWREVVGLRGLPESWSLFWAKKVRVGAGIAAPIALLSLATKPSLSLRGGIRVSSRASRYFSFAPPEIELEGATLDTAVFCGDEFLEPGPDGLYIIPHRLLEDAGEGRVAVEAQAGGHVVAKVSFSVAREGLDYQAGRLGPLITLASDTAGQSTPAIRGAAVSGVCIPDFCFDGLVPLLAKGTLRFIGREPGQIATSLDECVGNWQPIWVVQSRRMGAAIFCGTGLEKAGPIAGRPCDRRKLKEWKEFLWVRRKDITPPEHPQVRELWRQYVEAARNV